MTNTDISVTDLQRPIADVGIAADAGTTLGPVLSLRAKAIHGAAWTIAGHGLDQVLH